MPYMVDVVYLIDGKRYNVVTTTPSEKEAATVVKFAYEMAEELGAEDYDAEIMEIAK